MKPLSIAIVGATGAVGRELLAVLEQRRIPLRRLVLLASSRSAGAMLRCGDRDYQVELLEDESFADIDYAVFAAGAAVSREHAERAVEHGAVVVDNSSAFRLEPDVPLVVPECNLDALRGHRGIVANPNCSTTLLVMALAPLHRAAGVRRVVVSTYQAASGAGQGAVEELRVATRAALDGVDHAPVALPHSLALNLFPQVDRFEPDGYTREEDKMLRETAKILDAPELALEATCVRVPVERCHSEAVTVALERELSPQEARELWDAAPGVVVVDEPERGVIPQPVAMDGQDAVAVGRARQSRVFRPGLSFWLVGDQLRKGAALNAVQIVENLCRTD